MAKSEALTKPAGGTLVTLESLREDLPKNFRFEQLVGVLREQGEAAEAADLGDGWDLVPTEGKAKLVGVPMVVLDWQQNEGRTGLFTTLRIVTSDDRRLIINDGSTGIHKQLEDLSAKGESRALVLPHGLRRSDYEYTDKNTGKTSPASTFYLDFSG